MRCHKVREHLYEYVSGSLSPHQRRAMEEHLGRCASCRKEMESFKPLEARLRQEIPLLWGNVTPSPGFEARLKRAIPPSERPSRMADRLAMMWQSHHPRAITAGIAACVILALAVSVPLTLIGGGAGPEMIAQDSNPVTAAPRPAAESAGPTLKMAVPPAPESGPPDTPVPSPTNPPPAGAITEDINLSGTYGFAVGEASAALPDEGPAISEDLILAKERELALWIAFSDPEVKETLKAKTLLAIDVQGATIIGDFECPGPTVALTFRNTDAPETTQYICVNLGTHQVTGIFLAQESQSTEH